MPSAIVMTMESPTVEQPVVWRTVDLAALGMDGSTFARAGFVRVARGYYVAASAWGLLDRDERHALRARAILPRLSPHLVASHHTAAVLWGLPTRRWAPTKLHVIDSHRHSSDSTAVMVRHAVPLDESDIVSLGGLRVTTAARTAVDLALLEGFSSGLISFDGGLRTRLFDRTQALAVLDDRPRSRHRAATSAALQLSSPLPGSGGESFVRGQFFLLGIPEPTLQQPFSDSSGRIGDVDFWWEKYGRMGELDGDLKYLDPRYRSGRSAEEVFLAEKKREDRLRALPACRGFFRFGWAVAASPPRLLQAVTHAGVPRGQPPRGTSAWR